jgi:hypothetical protein
VSKSGRRDTQSVELLVNRVEVAGQVDFLADSPSPGVDSTPDPDIEAAYRWLLSYLPVGEWQSRKVAIEEHLEAVLDPQAEKLSAPGYHRLIGPDADQIGWYLYLAEPSLYEPRLTEVN